ncbi:MAG: NAD(P)H-dependent oxidoreductase [Planctomycetota bacterium]
MSKKVLIIDGNPNPESFGASVADSYVVGARKRASEIKRIDIRSLDFDPNLPQGYATLPDLEPDLQKAIDKIVWSEHMVWIHPIWWQGLPAMMKGFIDRTFLPDITFKYVKGPIPMKLLTGRTGRIIATADTPGWYQWLLSGNTAMKQLKYGTLKFCGVTPVHSTYIAPIRKSSLEFRETWLQRIERLGEQLV